MPLRKADPRYRASAFFKAHGVTGEPSRQSGSYSTHGHAQTLQILRQKALKLLRFGNSWSSQMLRRGSAPVRAQICALGEL